MRTIKTKRMVQLAILIAIMFALHIMRLDMIMIPPVSITTLHIPVIIGACLMGPLAGGVLGATFGLISMITATFRATSPIDMLFSPFTSDSPLLSLVLCFIPRILLGVAAGYIYKYIKNYSFSVTVSAVVGTILHTASVLGLMMVIFGNMVIDDTAGTTVMQAVGGLKGIVLTIGSINGIIEIALAVILSLLLIKPLIKIIDKMR